MTVHPVTTNGGSPDPQQQQQNTTLLVGKQFAGHQNTSINNSITMNNNNTVLVNGTPGGGPPSLPSAVVAPTSVILNNKAMVGFTSGQTGIMNNNNSSGPATLSTNGGIALSAATGVTAFNKPVGLIPGTQQHLQTQLPIGTQGAGTVVVTTSFPGSSSIINSTGPVTTPGHLQQPTYINTGSGLQLVNMNNVRPTIGGGINPVTLANNVAGTATKTQGSRMILNPQMIGARPGQPGQFTLQALPGGLQPGAQGGHHLLVKTENGQYQLLRVGPPTPAPTAATGTPSSPALPPSPTVAPTTVPSSVLSTTSSFSAPTPTAPATRQAPVGPTTATTQVVSSPAPSVIATNTNVITKGGSSRLPAPAPATPTPSVITNHTTTNSSNPTTTPATTNYRLPSVPSVPPTAASNSPSGMGMTASMSMQQMHPVVPPHPHALQSHLPSSVLTPANASSTTATATSVSQMTPDTAKNKCKNFLSFLLELSAKQNATVARNVKGLIQGLVDGKVDAESFSDRLQKEVNSQPQPCLVGFLKKSLPPLRHSLATKELIIEGIRPPPVASVPTVPPVTALIPQTPPQQPKIRPPPPVPTTPVRIITPISTSTPLGAQPVTPNSAPIPRSTAAAVQQRFSTPKSGISAKAAKAAAAKEKAEALAAAAATSPKVSGPPAKATKEKVDKKAFASSSGAYGDDDINDVAAMGGVNLAEESQRILGSTEMIGTQIRSCRDETFLHTIPLQAKIKAIAAKYGLDEPPPEVAALISHATEERLKTLLEKLSVIAEHRLDVIKMDDRYEVSQDVKGQLRFLEELDKLERKRHDEQEREMLIKAAKSRSKSEDPEQAKLKAKAKEMQRVAQEEMRQREANLTALQAIGPRKKQKLDSPTGSHSTTTQSPMSGLGALSSPSRPQMPLRPRLKRVSLRDLLFLLEQEKDTTRSEFLYKHFLK